jgi:anti-sigma regulatory factor (Ser/Thr protein kinase)
MKRSRTFPERAPSVALARQFVSETLTALPREARETVALLVSEVATNAIVHAASAFDVTVIYPTQSGRLRIEVADGDRTRPTPLRPPPSVPHGRGLQLLSALCAEWGVEEATTRSGKTVWFEMAVVIPSASTTSTEVRSRLGRSKPRNLSSFRLMPWPQGG